MSDVPMKHCTNPKCEQPWKPATTDFFGRDKWTKDGFRTRCKTCMNRKHDGKIIKDYVTARGLASRTGQNHHDILRAIHEGSLPATNIGKEKKTYWAIYLDIAREYSNRMGWEYIDEGHPQVIKPTIGTPDQCGACGTKRNHIFGDVNPDTLEKYGYLCSKCHQLVRDFQGDPKRIRNVLSYVERTRKAEARINKKKPTALAL